MNLLITGGLYELIDLQDIPEQELGDPGADLFNFGLTVYSTNAKAGLAPRAL